MAPNKAIPPSAETFLQSGVEAVQCSICTEPFTAKHVAVQIKGCGHQFGKICLEKWLQQNSSSGTCPLCRDVLFKTSRASRVDGEERPRRRTRTIPAPSFAPVPTPTSVPTPARLLLPVALDAPVSPARFCEYYKQANNVRLSAQGGFLDKLWIQVSRPSSDGHYAAPIDTICQAFDGIPGPERDVLLPYIARIHLIGLGESFGICPVTSLAHSLDHFSDCCQSDFTPSPATWHAILLYHTNSAIRILHWSDIRDAAWSLQQLRIEGRDSGEHWRSLYLFFFIMAIHRSQQWTHLLPYEIKQVRTLLRTLDCSDASAELSRQDTATKLFLSAAAHVLVLSKIDGGSAQDARCARLLSESTSDAQLKQDVEELWLEATSLGTNEIAAGFPDSWWYCD